jgi:nitroimidazol reductase NimA-like FMN-containing flavoprotein (pyridoxamine 5'-phosphate oxidase superfamily)
MGRHLVDLSVDECWAQLETAELARIAWNAPAGPELLPVNYVSHDGALWIRTTAHSAIARQADESPVAIEVDTIDPATHVGWSVVVRGRAEAFYHEDQVPADVRALRSWPAGARPLWIQVRPEQITGRRLLDE